MMKVGKHTKQLSAWAGEWGDAYVERNPQSIEAYEALYRKDYGVTRESMNQEFLENVERTVPILEVGANIGVQLEFLRLAGFNDLHGIDVNERAVQEAKHLHPGVEVILGSGFDLSFGDGGFGLVFTSGVLIHISPDDIHFLLREMHRATNRYIWGFEYYAPSYTEVPYRGTDDLLWKTDFAALFLSICPGVRLVKEKKYPMTDGVNVSQMYLLEKIT
jgi:pseudaminic acid biosynthesis-associated methylase